MLNLVEERVKRKECAWKGGQKEVKKLREKEKGEYFPRNEYVILREIEGGKERSEKRGREK